MNDKSLTPEQIAVLRAASPTELEFLVGFARNYETGQKFACWTARAVVALGAMAGALTGLLALVKSVGWLK